jgi:hypothetical protein
MMAKADRKNSAQTTPWRNRIVGYDTAAPDQLLANPRNFRIHPQMQQDVLQGVIKEVGWVQDVIVNRTTGFVLDGHLRVALAMRHNEPTIPVKYVELSEEEEALVLATLDPIGALAVADKQMYTDLLRDVQSGEAAVQQFLSEQAGIGNTAPVGPPEDFSEYDESIDTEYCCPKCGYEWSGKPR